jgi:hypothetical protein
LLGLLKTAWVRTHTQDEGSIYIVSGFGNFNGGVRFYDLFRSHVAKGGKVVSFFSGSTAQRLTSRQVAEELLNCGAEVNVVNRKRLLHAKCYGWESGKGNSLIVSSGNFTGPGMSQNVEASLLLQPDHTRQIGFKWGDVATSLRNQRWDFHRLDLAKRTAPGWQLLYDEYAGDIRLDETEEVTMLLTLSHADTARIQASPDSAAGKGTQYFWLSKDCYDFFPPLTILNNRGSKSTYSCVLNLNYVDLGISDNDCRVTFEAENNLDFRLGTGKLRYTKKAVQGDMAAITRVGEREYELRLFRQDSKEFKALLPYTVHFIGHQGKRYGYIPNAEFAEFVSQKAVGAIIHQ